ncbi:MAG: hypothetical protein ABI639_09465 [Thermoanaerobaculia bacterium]
MNASPIQDALKALIDNGWPVRIAVSTAGAPPDEIPTDLVAQFPEILILDLDAEKLKHGAEIETDRISFELAFHRVLGGIRRLTIPYHRLISVQFEGGAPPPPTPETAKTKPVRVRPAGMRSV